MIAVGAAVLIVAGLVWLARRLLLLVTVDGASMAPAYRDGDRVLAMRGARRALPGRVVIFAWPPAGTGILVKRVAAVAGEPIAGPVRAVVADPVVPAGHIVVLGDGPGSVDSREWGLLPVDRIIAVVLSPRR